MWGTHPVFYNKACHAFMFPDDGPNGQAQKLTLYLESLAGQRGCLT